MYWFYDSSFYENSVNKITKAKEKELMNPEEEDKCFRTWNILKEKRRPPEPKTKEGACYGAVSSNIIYITDVSLF